MTDHDTKTSCHFSLGNCIYLYLYPSTSGKSITMRRFSFLTLAGLSFLSSKNQFILEESKRFAFINYHHIFFCHQSCHLSEQYSFKTKSTKYSFSSSLQLRYQQFESSRDLGIQAGARAEILFRPKQYERTSDFCMY